MTLALFLLDDMINGYGRKIYPKKTQYYIGGVLNMIDQNKKTKQVNPNVPNLKKLLKICNEERKKA